MKEMEVLLEKEREKETEIKGRKKDCTLNKNIKKIFGR